MTMTRPLGSWLLLAAAALGPPLLCLALVPVRSDIENTNVALALVLIVVAAASAGDRAPGILAAVTGGLAFDYFLTTPYGTFTINRRDDVITDVLLIVVGVAVTEIAVRAKKLQARAGQTAGYLAGLQDASEAVAAGFESPSQLISRVCDQLVKILGIRSCRFDYGTGLGAARLHHDGRVTQGGQPVDVEREGWPTGSEIELVVESGGSFRGRFLLTAPPGCRPTTEQRRVAVTLADQVGAALTEYSLRRPDL